MSVIRRCTVSALLAALVLLPAVPCFAEGFDCAKLQHSIMTYYYQNKAYGGSLKTRLNKDGSITLLRFKGRGLSADLITLSPENTKCVVDTLKLLDAGTIMPIPDSINHRSASAGPAPIYVAVENLDLADLNGDGLMDQVSSGFGSQPSASVAFGKGDGTLQPRTDYPVGPNPVAVQLADLDGDGKLDLIVAYQGDFASDHGGISVLLGNGGGTFKTATNFQAGFLPMTFAVEDYNGDGKLDLAVANNGNFTTDQGSVSILLGNGDGSFKAPVNLSSGGGPTSILAADFNGDGKLDLAVSEGNGGTVSSLIGNGNGTFKPRVATQVGIFPSFLTAVDFNHDGKLDLAVLLASSNEVAVMRGRGDGTFGSPVRILGGSSSDSFAILDLENDGTTFAIFLPDGAQGGLVVAGVINGNVVGTPLFPAGNTPGSVAVADFNGDGKPDAATVGSNNLSILLGASSGLFQTAQSVPVPGGPATLVVGDFNGDGRPDIAAALDANSGAVEVLIGKGDGAFFPGKSFATGKYARSVAIADFNGDGKLDLVTANEGVVPPVVSGTGSLSVLLGNGDGTFHGAAFFAAGTHPVFVATGDGKQDIVVANSGIGQFSNATDPGGMSVLLGKGDGTFQNAVNFTVGLNPTSVAIGDLNGDGKPDLVATTTQSGFEFDLAVILGNGDGTFHAPVLSKTEFGPNFVVIHDFDGDGKQDLMVAYCCGDTDIAFLAGKGDGTFQAEFHFPGGASPSAIALGDFNNDGKLDLAIANAPNNPQGNVAVILNNLGGSSTGCSYTLSAASLQPAAAGGSFHIALQTGATCAWSVAGLPSWITVAASSGTGPASITLVVAANTGAARSATLTIGGKPVTVNQAVAACAYTLSSGGQVFSSAAGNGTITITAQAGCAWTASGGPTWVTFTSAVNGSGNGTLSYQVAANAGADRSGVIQIANATFAIEQVSTNLPNGAIAGSMAQIASAGGWKTTFTLINSGSTTAQLRLSFFGDNGSPLSLALTFPQSSASAGPLLAAVVDRTLNAGASLVIETTGPDSQAVQVGWAQLISTGHVDGFATFTVTASHQEAVVPLEIRTASVYLLAFDNTGGLLTGLALANNSAQAAVISLVIRDDTGAQIGAPTINLPGHGHTSFMLTQNYAITAGKRGTIEFHTPAGGQISVLGLRANAAALTTLPLLVNVTAGGGSIAQVASAGGWKTTFVFVNTGSSAAQITLDFFGDNGAALTLPLGFPQSSSAQSASSLTKTLLPNTSLIIETQGVNTDPVVTGSARLTTTGNVGGFAIFRDGGTSQEAVVPLETRTGGAFILAFDNTNGVATGLALANIANSAAAVNTVLRDDTGAVLGTPVINLVAHGHKSFLLSPAYAVTAGKRGTVEFPTPPGGQISALGLRATPAGTLTTISTVEKK